MSASAAASAGAPQLSVIDDGELAVSVKAEKRTAQGSVTVLNPSDRPRSLKVELQALSAGRVRVQEFTPRRAQPGATRVAVTFAGVANLDEKVTGQLLVFGGVKPAVRSVAIAPALEHAANLARGAIAAAALAFIIVLFGVVLAALLAGKIGRLAAAAPGPKWSFDSWATTLTAAGAVLGTVLSAVTYPDVPSVIDKDTLVKLNVLFGALIVVGPFVFQAIRHPKVSAVDPDTGYWGFNITLLLACAVTAAAVVGELFALSLLGYELVDGTLTRVALIGCAGTLSALALYYSVVTAYGLATTDWKAAAAAAAAEAKPQEIVVILRRDTRGLDAEPPPEDQATVTLQTPRAVARPAWHLP